jgi:hypothetical protein
MLKKPALLLYANVALYVYTLIELIKILVTHNNFFTEFLTNLFINFNLMTTKILTAITAWQNLLYLALFVLIIFLLLKFWRVTFILLEIISAFLILDVVILLAQHQFDWTNLFFVAVLIVTLMNIWQNSKHLKFL